jgi:cytochrome c peroxidase
MSRTVFNFRAERTQRASRGAGIGRAAAAVVVCGLAFSAYAQHRVPNNGVPPPLTSIPVPGVQPELQATTARTTTANGVAFVKDRKAAIALGKALFWDMQLGSDGQTACASCHFHAGADPRERHQVFPERGSFGSVGLNGKLSRGLFPLTRFADPKNRDSARSSWGGVIGSQGVLPEEFLGVQPGAVADARWLAAAPTPFHDGAGIPHTQVTGRNAPSVINAVYNFRQFWDGRGNPVFNGETPFGNRDPNARVTRVRSDKQAENVRIAVKDSSLASQAVGPTPNEVEMSATGRRFADVGRRLLDARPLALQKVDRKDSVLGPRVSRTGVGLEGTYRAMIAAAFDASWHTDTPLARVAFGPEGRTLVAPRDAAFTTAYTVPEANFSLFFGLALQAYQSTLVSGETPFDKHLSGLPKQLDTSALRGMSLFYGTKAKCSNCHGGPEFTNASVRNVLNNGPLHRMVMGNNQSAVYDEGFYNIGVRPTAADIGNGSQAGGQPAPSTARHLPKLAAAAAAAAAAAGQSSGLPLSSSEISRLYDERTFEYLVGTSPAGVKVGAQERTAVNGAFKTPGLRNIALTAPYFHNGDSLTLHQVVQFYNRGGNFHRENMADLDADIQPLGLSDDEVRDLVRFLESLTDNRVWRRSAPFDHPQLFVKVGHGTGIVSAPSGRWRELAMQEIPAVGAGGYNADAIPAEFLGNLQSGSEKRFTLARTRWAADPQGNMDTQPACLTLWATAERRNGGPSSTLSIEPCSEALAARQLFEVRPDQGSPVPSATFHLYNARENKYLALRNGGVAAVSARELRTSDSVRVVDMRGLRVPVFNESGVCLYPRLTSPADKDSLGAPRLCVDAGLPLAVRR